MMWTPTKALAIQLLVHISSIYLRAEPDFSEAAGEDLADMTVMAYGNDTGASTTHIPFVTVTPASTVDYQLNLTNPESAVLDSTLNFTAEVTIVNSSFKPEGKNFSFVWMNMADSKTVTTMDDYTASFPVMFPSSVINPSEYTMTVAVSESENPSKILAFQTRKFDLTEKLNGILHVQQDLEYQRLNDTFSTAQDINLTVSVNDQFSAGQSPVFQYFWSQNGTFVLQTKEPEVVTRVGTPGNSSMSSLVLATVAVRVATDDRSAVYYAVDEDVQFGPQDSAVKSGTFEQNLYFKDPLSECSFLRVDSDATDKDVKIGTPALINISCAGSFPSAVCVNITSYNTSLLMNDTCMPELFVDTLHHQVQVILNTSGWNDVYFFVYNDVTRFYLAESYYAYDPDSANIPALVLPIVFAFVGLFIVVVGAMYIARLRKKPLVEVANFDFHPNLNDSASQRHLSRVMLYIKHAFTPQRGRAAGYRYRGPPPDTASGWDSLSSSGSSLQPMGGGKLYESL